MLLGRHTGPGGGDLEKDLRQAELYLLEAAKKTYIPAMYELGRIYMDRKEKDIALSYFLEAASYGCIFSATWVAVILSSAGQNEEASAWALICLERGSESGAAKFLACMATEKFEKPPYNDEQIYRINSMVRDLRPKIPSTTLKWKYGVTTGYMGGDYSFK